MTALAGVPAKKIVRAIAHAAERWRDADLPLRVRATDRICERTGYSLPVVDYALDRLFQEITPQNLFAVIESELGGPETLDGFARRKGRPDAWAQPAGNVCVISSRSTIGVAIVPAAFALCAKCDVAVKDREDALVAAFFSSLHEELNEFREAARASMWHPLDEDAPELTPFDVVVAFGSDGTLSQIGASLRYETRFIPFGSRASAGYVSRESMTETEVERIAAGAARDIVLYESEGCLSLHVLFLERGGAVDPDAFAQRLASALERMTIEFPPGAAHASQLAAIAHKRDAGAFRAAAGHGAVFSNAAADYAVLVNPPRSQAPPFLPRTIAAIAVDSPGDAVRYVHEHNLALEGLAIAGARDDVVTGALAAGAVRLTTFGELQHPPLAGNHGGRARITDFVKWIEKTW